MNSRLLWSALFLAAAVFVSAEPRSVVGSEKGPVVVVVSGAEGAVNLWHEAEMVRGWIFPGTYTAAVVLAGPLDKVEWDGEAAVILSGGADASAVAKQALNGKSAPRLVMINADGAAQVLAAPAEEAEMDYDAASAATAEE